MGTQCTGGRTFRFRFLGVGSLWGTVNISALKLALSQACFLLSSPSKSQTGDRCWEVECLGVQASSGLARPWSGNWKQKASYSFLLLCPGPGGRKGPQMLFQEKRETLTREVQAGVVQWGHWSGAKLPVPARAA